MRLPKRPGSQMHYEARRERLIESYIAGLHPPYVNMLIAEAERQRDALIELGKHECSGYDKGYEDGKDAMAQAYDEAPG